MKKWMIGSVFFVSALIVMAAVPSMKASAPPVAQGTVVFDSIPSPTPGNVPSEGFQCCQNAGLGDMIQLEADTPRTAGYMTVLMSSWSLHSNYLSMPAVGYTHPVTLNIYADAAAAAAHGTPYATKTQVFDIPWRPAGSYEDCPVDDGYGPKWKSSNGTCYNGYAFTIVFDLRSLSINLPESFVYEVAYNTQTWGYQPLNLPGPYESLNVGVNSTPPVTGDINPDEVYRSMNNGANGLLPESGWAPYTPAVQFTTFAVPTTTASCKNGAWQNLVRADFSPFKNQGACVSYVNTGK